MKNLQCFPWFKLLTSFLRELMYPSSNDKDWKKESSDVTLIIARRSSKGIIFFLGCNSTKYLLSRRKQGRRIVEELTRPKRGSAWFPLSPNLYVGGHIDEIKQNRVNVWSVVRTFSTRDLSYIVSDLLFTHVNCTLVRVNFHCRVNFTCVNKIEAMYGRSRVNVKVEPCPIFTFTRTLP